MAEQQVQPLLTAKTYIKLMEQYHGGATSTAFT